MPISFVGSGIATGAAASAVYNFSSLLNTAGAAPALANGDAVYIIHAQGGASNTAIAVTAPTGYTEITTNSHGNDTNDVTLRIYRKFMGATPDTSVTIPGNATAGYGWSANILVLRGVSPTNPSNVATVAAQNINTGVPDPGSVTPFTPGSWTLAAVASAGSSTTPSANYTAIPTGFNTTTNMWRTVTNTTGGTYRPTAGFALKTDWTSGAVDPGTFTTTNTNAANSWASLHHVVTPLLSTTMPTDNFDDNSIDTAKWDVNHALYTATTTGSVTVEEVGQKLKITPMISTAGQKYNGIISKEHYDFSNASIFAKLLTATSGTQSEAYIGVGPIPITTGKERIALTIESTGTNTWNMVLYRLANTSGTAIGAARAWSPTNERWLRIRFDGTNVYVEAAPDSAADPPSSWSAPIYTVAKPTAFDPTSCSVYLQAGTYGSTPTPGIAEWDGFNTAASGVVAVERVYKGSAGEAIVRVGSAPLSTYYLGSTGLWP